MPDRSFLTWPFFEDRHRELADALEQWCAANLGRVDHSDTDAACRELVRMLGQGGWLDHSAVDPADPGTLDVRSLCLIRETLARHDGLADFAFAMQGLGTGAISLFGSDEQRQWLARTRAGSALSAFALSEPRSGSDVADMEMTATRDGNGFVLNGEKTWISNGGIADVYTVFARTGEAPGAKGLSAFVVPADTPGLEVVERLEVMAPHPLARLRFDNVRVDAGALIGTPGQGFKVAMAVLDVFRSTVAAAALGFARRALDVSLTRVRERQLFGAPLSDLQMVQGHIADMALDVDAAALLVYRAAWTKDMGAPRVSREAAMAKLFSTDQAQQVIDKAVQLHGGDGVRVGGVTEQLYREIRALRIYEGASDVQKVVIARAVLGREAQPWSAQPKEAMNSAPVSDRQELVCTVRNLAEHALNNLLGVAMNGESHAALIAVASAFLDHALGKKVCSQLGVFDLSKYSMASAIREIKARGNSSAPIQSNGCCTDT